MTSWLSDPTAAKVVKTYVDGYLDCSGYFLNRVGNVMIGNTDYPGYNVNQRSLLVNGQTQMNGNLTINGNISVNSTNIALGFQAGNIVNGDQVGLPNGSLTTAVGSYSGMNHTGTNNTFIGSVAGQSSTTSYFSRTGSNNTYVGYAAQANGTYSNSTAIGTGAIITASSQIVLGTTAEQVVIKGNLYSKATATNQSIATFEGSGGGGTTVNLDLCSYLNSSRTPTNRITCIDDALYSGHYVFYSKTPGADANPLVERMRIASDGTVSIPGKLGINQIVPTAPLHIKSTGTTNPTTNGLHVANDTNTTGQHAMCNVRTGGASGGSPMYVLEVFGASGWTMGIDNSDSQKFKIANEWGTFTNTYLSIASNGTVSIPGKLIQSASAHLEFSNIDNSVAYYNSAGTSISSGTTNVEMYYRFTNVRTNINWGTLSYLKNAGLYVPYTGIYFIQFAPGTYTTNKECFISKNGMTNSDINSSPILAVMCPNSASSLCCTTFLNASEFINIGSYSGASNGGLSIRATFCITLIQRTA